MLSQAAPQAWKLASEGVFAKGAAELIVGAILLILALLVSGVAAYFGRLYYLTCRDASKNEDAQIAFLCGVIVAGMLGVVMFLFALGDICDSDAWARVISPQGYLAQSILIRAMGN